MLARGEEIRFDNLERLVSEAGSAVRLAHRAGMTESYLNRIRNRIPPRISVRLAARPEQAMGKPGGWMDEDNAAPTQGALTLPLVFWEQVASFARAAREAPGTVVPVASLCQLYSGPHTFVLQVKDVTMAPVFAVRDLVFVDPAMAPSNGKYVLEQAVCRRSGDRGPAYSAGPVTGGIGKGRERRRTHGD